MLRHKTSAADQRLTAAVFTDRPQLKQSSRGQKKHNEGRPETPREHKNEGRRAQTHTHTYSARVKAKMCAHPSHVHSHVYMQKRAKMSHRESSKHFHSPLKCVCVCMCVCRGPTLSGEWKNADNERLSGRCVKMNVCVKEAALMFIAVVPEVKPRLRLHSPLLSDLHFLFWSHLHHTQTRTRTHTHAHTHKHLSLSKLFSLSGSSFFCH